MPPLIFHLEGCMRWSMFALLLTTAGCSDPPPPQVVPSPTPTEDTAPSGPGAPLDPALADVGLRAEVSNFVYYLGHCDLSNWQTLREGLRREREHLLPTVSDDKHLLLRCYGKDSPVPDASSVAVTGPPQSGLAAGYDGLFGTWRFCFGGMRGDTQGEEFRKCVSDTDEITATTWDPNTP